MERSYIVRKPDGEGDRFLADPIPTPHRDDHERRPLILKIYAPPGAAQELTVESAIITMDQLEQHHGRGNHDEGEKQNQGHADGQQGQADD